MVTLSLNHKEKSLQRKIKFTQIMYVKELVYHTLLRKQHIKINQGRRVHKVICDIEQVMCSKSMKRNQYFHIKYDLDKDIKMNKGVKSYEEYEIL